MPQLDIYIWFSSIANFTSFFFLFYFFFIEFLLVNIVRVQYFKSWFTNLIDYMTKYLPKFNYVVDNGFYDKMYIGFFLKKSMLVKKYNQVLSVYSKNLKIYVFKFVLNTFSLFDFIFSKNYIFNFLKESLYREHYLKINIKDTKNINSNIKILKKSKNLDKKEETILDEKEENILDGLTLFGGINTKVKRKDKSKVKK